MLERIKINGKTGQLAEQVSVEHTKQKLSVSSEIPFSKRYNAVSLHSVSNITACTI